MTSDSQSAISRLKDSGLLRSQGLIGGKWLDAYDGKKFQVDSIEDYFTFKFFNVASKLYLNDWNVLFLFLLIVRIIGDVI